MLSGTSLVLNIVIEYCYYFYYLLLINTQIPETGTKANTISDAFYRKIAQEPLRYRSFRVAESAANLKPALLSRPMSSN